MGAGHPQGSRYSRRSSTGQAELARLPIVHLAERSFEERLTVLLGMYMLSAELSNRRLTE